MQVANCRLLLHDNGSDVALSFVTPAEVALLGKMHMGNVKQWPIKDLKVMPGEAASIASPAEYYTQDEFDVNGEKTIKAGDIKTKATYRPRTDAEELSRLRRKYHKTTIDAAFPGLNPVLPKTFDEVKPALLDENKPAGPDVWTNDVTVPAAKAPAEKPNPTAPGGPPSLPPAK